MNRSCQLAEVAVPRELFETILQRIEDFISKRLSFTGELENVTIRVNSKKNFASKNVFLHEEDFRWILTFYMGSLGLYGIYFIEKEQKKEL